MCRLCAGLRVGGHGRHGRVSKVREAAMLVPTAFIRIFGYFELQYTPLRSDCPIECCECVRIKQVLDNSLLYLFTLCL